MSNFEYVTNMEPRFGALEQFDVRALAASVRDRWYNETLCAVNDAFVRIGVLEGEYHWHTHTAEDEFFLVIQGRMLIELEGRDTVTLETQQGIVVPRGLRHRPVVPERSVVLMIETATVTPTGDDAVAAGDRVRR